MSTERQIQKYEGYVGLFPLVVIPIAYPLQDLEANISCRNVGFFRIMTKTCGVKSEKKIEPLNPKTYDLVDLELLKLLLPEFLVDYFEVVDYEKRGEGLHLFFEEKNDTPLNLTK